MLADQELLGSTDASTLAQYVPPWCHVELPPHTSRWLGFSHFKLNTYLTGLFPDRFVVKNGFCQITLRPAGDPRERLINTSLTTRQAFEGSDIENLSMCQSPNKELIIGARETWNWNKTRKTQSVKELDPMEDDSPNVPALGIGANREIVEDV
jgi:hypothetical protein